MKYFPDKHLLRKAVQCRPCGREYSLIKKKGSVTGFQFRCPRCGKKEFVEGFSLQWLPSPASEDIRTHVLYGQRRQAPCRRRITRPSQTPPPSSGICTSATFVRGSCCANHLYSVESIAACRSTNRSWLRRSTTMDVNFASASVGCLESVIHS